MLPITSIWIAILIIIQSKLGNAVAVAVAVANPDPVERSNTHTSTKLSRDGNYFSGPLKADSESSSDLVYKVGDVLDISWTTTLDVFNVTLWQRLRSRGGNDTAGVLSGGNIFSKTSPTSTLTNISWVVQPYTLNLETSPTFFLSIDAYTYTNTNAAQKSLDYTEWPSTRFVSRAFNMTSSSSSSSTSPQSPPSSETDSDSAGTATTTSNTEEETTNTPETSLTSTGKIALGLGAGIGAPLISLLAIVVYFQVRSARRKDAAHGLGLGHSHSRGQLPPIPPPPPPPEMALAMGGMGMQAAQHHHHHQQHHLYPPLSMDPSANLGLGIVPHIQPLYRTPPSELPQKLAKPVVLPPWEVDASTSPSPDPDSAENAKDAKGGVARANTTITVLPRARPNPSPRSALGGVVVDRERGRRGPGLGEGTGPGKKRSMWSTRRVGQAGYNQQRESTITIGIPELPGENYI
ncbi:hypothetical protein BJY01DRAFT_255246 [Aspergillus pseudoustus]|uniref:Mid2 domain-containing protein n=1 Tax=Aspergillus pseudoustus TaxID=1810923 RepID=A0ABR4INK9_9EURO